MKTTKYLFDLDGTITLEETLPRIAQYFGLSAKIDALTEATIKGDVPFIESFIRRVGILGKLPVDQVSRVIQDAKLNESIIEFIQANKDDCVIVTGNYRGWVEALAHDIGCTMHCSEGYLDEDQCVKLTLILKKEEIVRLYQREGFRVVYVGDGNNDAEAIRLADVGIACGIIHWPAVSVMGVCDYAAFDTAPLIRLLNQIKIKHTGTSLVISCAGIGSRLGMDQTKALVKLGGKTIIERQLLNFCDMDDIRIVVGYQAKKLIEHVNTVRRDVLFVFNHDYFHTKTGTSVYLGAQFAREYILAWDGDLIVHPDDIASCINAKQEYLGVSNEITQDAVNVQVNEYGEVTSFTREKGAYEWSGPAFLHHKHITYVAGNLYTMIEPYLPIKYKRIRAFDIDTPEDYNRAKILYDGWCMGNKKIHKYYNKLAENIKDPLEIRNKAKDFSNFDVAFMRKYANHSSSLLDMGSGSGLLLNHIIDCFKEIVAVEKYKKFSQFIARAPNVQIITCDLLEYRTQKKFDIVSLFGVMPFFNENESRIIYQKAFDFLKPNGLLIVKHQMGVDDDVFVDGFSEELQTTYYSEYRSIDKEINFLKEIGFKNINTIDIYPPEFNRWKNTHFYALICYK